MRVTAVMSLAFGISVLAACGSEAGEPQGMAASDGVGGAGAAAQAGAGGSSGSSGSSASTGGAGGASGQAGSLASAGTDGAGVASSAGAGEGGQSGALAAGAGGSGTPDGGSPALGVPLAERVCPAGESFEPPAAGTRTAQLVQDGFGFLEGPVWIASQGVLLFSDMDFAGGDAKGPPARIRRFTPPSTFDVLAEGANSNGLALLEEGSPLGLDDAETVLACVHDAQSLALVELNGARTPLAMTFDGKTFNSPNDLTVRSDGTVYFSDPDWQLGPRAPQLGFTGVFRVMPAPSYEVTLVSDALDKPNGVALSPDEQTLYVGSSGADVLAYPIAADGSTGMPSVFASPGGSDGMAVDCAGNLYVTSGGQVKVFSSAGDALYAIDVAESPSNVAFGGADRRTLYITARTGLYAIELEIPGLPY